MEDDKETEKRKIRHGTPNCLWRTEWTDVLEEDMWTQAKKMRTLWTNVQEERERGQ